MTHCLLSTLTLYLLAATIVDAAETVRVYRDDTVKEVSGTIADFDRDVLSLQNGNQSRKFPASIVLSVQTELEASHTFGRQHLVRGQWQDAIDSLSLAYQREQRSWVRQRVLRDLALAHKLSGNIPRSAAAALLLYRDFPRTNQLDALPLSWSNASAPANVRQRAAEWLAADPPESQLLGASWLLSGAARKQSIDTLRRLSSQAEPWIAQLSTAQLWRTELAMARADQCVRWERLVRQMPSSLRAGPLLLLGQAWERAGDGPRAAMIYMEVPILHPDDQLLAAETLMRAARLLETAERERAYHEIVTRYPFSPEATTARQELDALAQGNNSPNG